MAKRTRISRRGSKRLFKATANKVHQVNIIKPMRGCERL